MTERELSSPSGAQQAGPAVKSTVTKRRFAVIGSPISHSRSPRIHRAAYDFLGLDWTYDAFDVEERDFSAFIRELPPDFRGLSVTMPLKREAFELCGSRDHYAIQTGVVNTLIRGESEWSGFNTDVIGATTVLQNLGLPKRGSAVLLGAGATAVSMLVVLDHLAFESVTVCARRQEQLREIITFSEALTIEVRTHLLSGAPDDQLEQMTFGADLIVNTLPGDVSASLGLSAQSARQTALFDINYDPWPSPLCELWQSVGGAHADGLELLVQQAVIQIRLFVSGDAMRELEDESKVIEVMRQASVER